MGSFRTTALLYKKIFRCSILRQLSPFDWKCLQIGTQRAKALRKNEFIFLGGGFTSASWMLLVIRVVLLQWLSMDCQSFISTSVRGINKSWGL